MVRSSVLLAHFAVSIAAGQTAATDVARDASAIVIAQSSLAAMGGAKLSAAHSVIMSGTILLSGPSTVSFPITIKTHGTNQLRSELTTQKGLRVTVISGGAGAIQQSDGTIKRLAPENVAGYRNQYLPALSSLFEVNLTSMPIVNLGPASSVETAKSWPNSP